MSQTTIIIIAVIAVVGLLLLLLRSRKQSVSFDAGTPLARSSEAKPAAPAPAPATVATPEGDGVTSEIAAAVEDVVDQFVGLDAHPSGIEPKPGPGDALTTLKGLGPKAEARLHELGVTTFAQIADWNEADVDAIDAQLGAFKGRIRRDKWVEQAKLLAKGDSEAFEAAFGKLGS